MQKIVLLTILILLPATQAYTPYPPEETQSIRLNENNRWNSMLSSFHPSEILTFVVDRRVYFYLNSSTNQTIKMRGRAYFVDDRRKFVEMKDLSPFDVTKIYVYSANRLIIKSEEFYERFVFPLPINGGQMYQIMFEDGPPGPPKLIQWEVDYEAYQIGGMDVALSRETMQIMSGRLKQIEQFVEQSGRFTGLTSMRQASSKIKLVNDSAFYENYLIGEGIFICVVVLYETLLLKKMLGRNDNIIMI